MKLKQVPLLIKKIAEMAEKKTHACDCMRQTKAGPAWVRKACLGTFFIRRDIFAESWVWDSEGSLFLCRFMV